MATRPKLTEQNIVADGRHVAAAARRHLDFIQAFDARREKKLLPEERMARFELRIEGLGEVTGIGVTDSGIKTQAATSEADHREGLYKELGDLRAVLRVSYQKENPGVCRAFGTGLDLSPRSTPVLLTAGRAVVSSWKEPAMRRAAEAAGIDEAQVTRITQLVQSLGEADTARNEALTKGRGRTLTKAELVRAVRAETTYVRQVAAVVFRGNPAVVTEFESTLPRQTIKSGGKSAGGKGKGAKGILALEVPRAKEPRGEKAAAAADPAEG